MHFENRTFFFACLASSSFLSFLTSHNLKALERLFFIPNFKIERFHRKRAWLAAFKINPLWKIDKWTVSLSFCLIGVKQDCTGILSNRDRDDFGRNSGLISSEHGITEVDLLFFLQYWSIIIIDFNRPKHRI